MSFQLEFSFPAPGISLSITYLGMCCVFNFPTLMAFGVVPVFFLSGSWFPLFLYFIQE
jgi:hypothetical protein